MTNNQETTHRNESVTFKQYVNACKKNKWWFLASLVCIVGIASLYLIMKEPVYERSAQVMIKEDSSPSSKLTAGLSMIQGMGSLFGASSNVTNELIAMQTPQSVMEVVKRLHLDYDYSVRPFLAKETLYEETLPINVTVSNLKDDDLAYMKIKLEGGKLTLWKFRKNKKKFSDEVEGHINQTIKTPIGDVKVEKTKYYTGKEDMTIRVMRQPLIRKTDDCLKRLDAGITEELGSVIDLTYEDVVPQRAVDFLNELIQVYNEKWMLDENQLNATTTQFIDNRMGEIVTELGRAEDDLTDYKMKHELPDIIETTKLAMKTSAELAGDLALLENQKASAQFILDHLRAKGHENEPLPVNLLINDKVLSTQIAEFNTLQLQRNSLVENSNTSNPLVLNLDKQLASMKSSIQAALTNAVAQASIQIKGLEKLQNESSSKVKNSPVYAKNLLSTERQRKIQEELYIFMLQKREENVLSQAFTPYKTRILSSPLGDIKPVAPKSYVVLPIAFLIALLLPAFWILMQLNVRQLMQEE
ncbi:MAG: chain-length determining protein [Prevotella sp.]|nr:chain-length determining protein [Prevotella sp.]